MNSFHFLHPLVLLTLIVTVPLVGFLWYTSWRLAQGVRDSYGERRLLWRFAQQMQLKKQAPRAVLAAMVLALFTAAAAGPAFLQAPEHIKAGTMQVMTVINVDPGMAAEDFHGEIPGVNGPGPNGSRLQEALYQVEHSLIPALQGNELGIVTNMGGAFVQANLTDDFNAIQFMIDNGWIKAGMTADGTDIGDAPCCGDNAAAALSAAVDAFQRAGTPAAQRVIVYFGDGGFTCTQADIAAAMKKLNAAHVRLIVIGDAQMQPLPVPIYNGKGKRQGWVQFNGKIAYSTYDPQALKALARSADNGEFIQLTSGSQTINWPSATGSIDKTQMTDRDVYYVPLSAALLLLVYLSLSGGGFRFNAGRRR